jgi:beta-xylosidase
MTYRDPVIPRFQPDASVCRVGKEFFLAWFDYAEV